MRPQKLVSNPFNGWLDTDRKQENSLFDVPVLFRELKVLSIPGQRNQFLERGQFTDNQEPEMATSTEKSAPAAACLSISRQWMFLAKNLFFELQSVNRMAIFSCGDSLISAITQTNDKEETQ